MIKINQIYYNDTQLQYIKSPSILYNNENDTSREYEYGIFRKEYFNGLDFVNNSYIGYMSWAFCVKTSATTQMFYDLVEANTGYDVYGINPSIFNVHFNDYKLNFWEQGNNCHVNILGITQDIFDDIGYTIDLATQKCDASNLLCCNYWVGNKHFWDEYIKFCEPIRQYMVDHNNDMNNIFFDEYRKGYFPYIMERIFTTFIIHTNIPHKIFNR